MKNQSNKLKQVLASWMALFLLALGALLLLVFFTYPNLKQALSIRAKLVEQKNELAEKLIPKRNMLESLDEEKLNSDLKQVLLLLPNRPEPPILLSTIEEAASQAGVSVSSLQYQSASVASQGSTTEGLDTVNLGFLVESDQEKVINFLQILSHAAPILNLNTITINLGETADLQQASSSIVTSFFDSPLPQSLGSIDEEIPMLTKEETGTLLTASNFSSLIVLEEGGGEGSISTEPTKADVGKSTPF